MTNIFLLFCALPIVVIFVIWIFSDQLGKIGEGVWANKTCPQCGQKNTFVSEYRSSISQRTKRGQYDSENPEIEEYSISKEYKVCKNCGHSYKLYNR